MLQLWQEFYLKVDLIVDITNSWKKEINYLAMTHLNILKWQGHNINFAY